MISLDRENDENLRFVEMSLGCCFVAPSCITYHSYLSGASVDAFKKGDWTALMVATTLIGEQGTHIVQFLISKGANVALKNKDGWTAMHLACKYGNIQTIRLLADTQLSLLLEPSRNGRLPIHIAGMWHCVYYYTNNNNIAPIVVLMDN